jgi:hypothetical protein
MYSSAAPVVIDEGLLTQTMLIGYTMGWQFGRKSVPHVPLGKRRSFGLALGEWRIDDGRREKLPNLADNPFADRNTQAAWNRR